MRDIVSSDFGCVTELGAPALLSPGAESAGTREPADLTSLCGWESGLLSRRGICGACWWLCPREAEGWPLASRFDLVRLLACPLHECGSTSANA